MRAKFELKYESCGNNDIIVSVQGRVDSQADKLNLIQDIGVVLGAIEKGQALVAVSPATHFPEDEEL